MALKRFEELREEDLTEGQIKELVSLYVKYRIKNVIAFFLYLGALILANFVTVIANERFIHSKQCELLFMVGNAMIILSGLRGTISEQRDILVEKVEKVAYADEE